MAFYSFLRRFSLAQADDLCQLLVGNKIYLQANHANINYLNSLIGQRLPYR